MRDVILAKKISFGEPKKNEILREQLTVELIKLKDSCKNKLFFLFVCSKLDKVFETLLSRLKLSRHQRRQPINKIELNAIRSKIETLKYMIDCFSEVKKSFTRSDPAAVHLNLLLDVLLRSDDHVTDQEVEDLEMEIKRLHRIVQFQNIQKSASFEYAQTHSAVKSLTENVEKVLFLERRYTDFVDNAIKKNLQDLAAKIDCTVNISDKERMEIVGAIGLAKGHWYKCPNGHPYAIGECGGANQISKCFCGAEIGGSDHHLLRSNQFAGEMDGATRHAWPGGLY